MRSLVAPLALAAGLAFGLLRLDDYRGEAQRLSKFLLQASVVCLEFGMNFGEVLQVGRSGFLYAALGIAFAMLIGMLLAMALSVEKTQGFLIPAGTAICGGSAIAALGPVTNADEEQMTVSMGTVFVLNSIALFIFPVIGRLLHLSQSQFDLWVALAIHDTSSVVAASAKYGALAFTIATTVKLARTLWIVPMSVGAAVIRRSRARIRVPWFIAYFCLAAVTASYLPRIHSQFVYLTNLGRLGLAVTLFLIGASLSRDALKKVGVRPLIQGAVLWVIVGVSSLLATTAGWIICRLPRDRSPLTLALGFGASSRRATVGKLVLILGTR